MQRKKDRLQVSYEILKESLSAFQQAANATKRKYFSELILCNSTRPNALFAFIDSVLNPTINIFF